MTEPSEQPKAEPKQKKEERGGLLKLAIERPVTVMVGVILTVFFGGAAVLALPIQLTPDIQVPTLTVRTTWPGATPQEIEREILEEQEEVLKSVQRLDRMVAEARPDQGSLTLEFEVGTDIDEALVRVSNQLQQVSSYPEAARQPIVATSNSSGPPLAVIIIRSRTPGDPVESYRTWVAEDIVPELERIKGVSDVRHLGGRDTEVHIDFDPHELAARGISVDLLANRVRAELKDRSGGDITRGKRRVLVRTMLAPAELDELEGIVLKTGPNLEPVRVGDVAKVRFGLRKATSVAFADDRPSMALLLSREAGTNVLEVSTEIRDEVERLDREQFAPRNLEMVVVSDQSGYIEGALDLVRQNLLLGAVLAIITLLVFLRSFGASVIISVAIPVCIFGTALVMTALGRTINIVSLAGITFAIGMVVDNSIVALENIETWRGKVTDSKEAALRGVQEVAGALLASTLTTAAVFIPIIAWEGEVGELLRDVAYAIAGSVIISLVVSVLVIPSLSARFLKAKKPQQAKEKKKRTGPLGTILELAANFRDGIARSVQWLLARAWRSIVVVAAAVVLTSSAAYFFLPKLEYLPSGNRNLVFGIMVPPPGYSVEELDKIGLQVQGQVASHIGVEKDGVPSISRSFFVGSPERLFGGAVAEDPEKVEGVLSFIKDAQNSVPGMISFATQASLFGRSIGGGRAVEVEISGPELTTLTAIGRQMFGMSRGALPGAQVRPVPSLDDGAPEVHIIPNRDKAAALQMRGDTLGLLVDAYIDGAIVGEYAPPGNPKVDVVLRAGDREVEAITTTDALRASPVVTPSGKVVPLEVLAHTEDTIGPTIIQRLERRRAITLQISPPEDIPLEQAIEIVESKVIAPMKEAGQIPDEVQINIAGTAGKLAEAKERFALILIIAFLLSYLLLAALFEDFLAPIAVLVTVPLAAGGGILFLRGVDQFLGTQPLDLMTALGFLILIGVVVNNAILVVDGSLAYLSDGEPLEVAVTEAVRGRVRPIFMSTMTSLAGLTPMVILPGSGSELYRGVGAVVLGGLAVSSLLTIFVVPSFFALLWRIRAAMPWSQLDLETQEETA
ncbi:MAG: efflux RND transporter permease subunit [Myxococcota bacterium]|nr:efflux RND transporter permease subunit [Myxococcota bacterium]